MTTPPSWDPSAPPRTPPEWPPPPPAPWDPARGDDWRHGYAAPQVAVGTDGFAIAALVLGVLPVMAGILGIVFGLIGRRRTKKSGQGGRGLATAGLVLGSLWFLLVVGIIVFAAASGPLRNDAGVVVSSGSVSWDSLQVGDCLESDPGDGATTADVRPCDIGGHVGEVFETFLWTGYDERLGLGRCTKDLLGYLGMKGHTDPGYGVHILHPRTGAAGNAVCFLVAPDGRPLYGTARQTGALHVATRASAAPAQASGEVSLGDLRPGDCISRLPGGITITLPVTPCRGRHQAEVYDLDALGSGAWPGKAQVHRLSLGRCRKTLPSFVKAPVGRTGYSIEYFEPSSASWAAGDTRVVCLLTDPESRPLYGDAKGAGRHRV